MFPAASVPSKEKAPDPDKGTVCDGVVAEENGALKMLTPVPVPLLSSAPPAKRSPAVSNPIASTVVDAPLPNVVEGVDELLSGAVYNAIWSEKSSVARLPFESTAITTARGFEGLDTTTDGVEVLVMGNVNT
jgi:hypothetical protein